MAEFLVKGVYSYLFQSDGPYNNVLKIKPPLAFSKENVDRFVSMLDSIFEDMALLDSF